MEFLITAGLATLLIGLALLLFRFVGIPYYRLEPSNVRRLLQTVLDETATTSDWDVFIGMPIRYNPELDEIRRRCRSVAETEMTERTGKVIFSARGRAQLELLLRRVESL